MGGGDSIGAIAPWPSTIGNCRICHYCQARPLQQGAFGSPEFLKNVVRIPLIHRAQTAPIGRMDRLRDLAASGLMLGKIAVD
jgi:hypothetical protein